MNWSELFRACAERYGWPPDVVSELTPLQIAVLLGADMNQLERGTRWISAQEFRALMAARKKGR